MTHTLRICLLVIWYCLFFGACKTGSSKIPSAENIRKKIHICWQVSQQGRLRTSDTWYTSRTRSPSSWWCREEGNQPTAVCGVKQTNPPHHALHADRQVGSNGVRHNALLEKQELDGYWTLKQQVLMSKASFMGIEAWFMPTEAKQTWHYQFI